MKEKVMHMLRNDSKVFKSFEKYIFTNYKNAIKA